MPALDHAIPRRAAPGKAIALALGLAFSLGAMAQGMSRTEYRTDKDKIEATYKSAKAACDAMSGNQKDICIAQAKGEEKVGKAELEARYEPSEKHTYDARVARAEADYEVAKEKCDDLSGNAKDVCQKDAKAKETAAKSDAKAQMKTAKSGSRSSEARRDAADDKRDANYSVAKEKCDAMSGDAKDRCLGDAKARYGK